MEVPCSSCFPLCKVYCHIISTAFDFIKNQLWIVQRTLFVIKDIFVDNINHEINNIIYLYISLQESIQLPISDGKKQKNRAGVRKSNHVINSITHLEKVVRAGLAARLNSYSQFYFGLVLASTFNVMLSLNVFYMQRYKTIMLSKGALTIQVVLRDASPLPCFCLVPHHSQHHRQNINIRQSKSISIGFFVYFYERVFVGSFL